MSKNKMHVETKERELIMTRMFDAPRELVFEAYSDCKHLMQWWGPREWPLATCDMDFREGGTWNYCMKGPGGELACGKAVYREIQTPEKIVYMDNFVDENGHVNEEMPGMLVTVELMAQNGTTKLTVLALFDSPEELKSILDMGVVEGFSETWDRLEEHLAKLQQ